MAGFSLKSSMRNVRANYEDFDDEGLEVSGTTDEVLEQIETAETEGTAAAETAQLDTAIADADQAEAVVDQIEDTIADGEAVIEAADEEAAASGDAPAIEPKDVAVMQERVRTFVSMTDGEGINFVLSSEAADKDGYNTFKVNLEGLKEVGERVKKFISDIWRKIVETFDRIVSYIKRLLPTKLNRLRALVKELNALDKSKAMKKADAYTKAADAFSKSALKTYAGAAYMIGSNLENADSYAANLTKAVEVVTGLVASAGDLRNKDDAKAFGEAFAAKFNDAERSSSAKIITDLAKKFVSNPKETAREELADETVNKAEVIGARPAGGSITFLISAETSKAADKDEDDDKDRSIYKIVSSTHAVAESDLGKVDFEIGKATASLSSLLKNSDKFASVMDKFNSAVKKFRKDVAESAAGNAFTRWLEGRAAEKAIRKYVNYNIQMCTKYDGEILAYAIAYGRACLAAYNAGKGNAAKA
jgi:hypothetical protein|nr:MAG TPA: hypothetical protein [Caudoviricetes sp.]